jgi:integrase
VRLSDDAYVFSFDPAGRQPMHPDSVTHRFSRLARRLGLRTRLHDLRHYAATQLIAGGVDLRTVSGRIGHAGGGATTLRVCTHFLAAADRQAAEVLEKSLRRPRRDRRPGCVVGPSSGTSRTKRGRRIWRPAGAASEWNTFGPTGPRDPER